MNSVFRKSVVGNGLHWVLIVATVAVLIPGLLAQSEVTDDAWAELQVSESKSVDGSTEKVTIYRLDDIKFDGYLRSAPTEGIGGVPLLVMCDRSDG
jgi:hypothetical protein